jgi:chromosome segregation ATPase
MQGRHITALFSLAMACIMQVEAAEFYRYRDASGKLVIGDSVPREYVANGYEVINETGRVVLRVAAAKTTEQLAAAREESQRRAEEEEQIRQARFHDQQLLLRYNSEEEILAAKERYLRQYENRVQILRNNLADLRAQGEVQQEEAANYERKGRDVPEKLSQSVASLVKEVTVLQGRVEATEAEQRRAELTFEADRARFIELRQQLGVHY